MAETSSIDVGQVVQASGGAGGGGAGAVPVQITSGASVSSGSLAASATQVDTGMNAATTNALLKLGSNLLQPRIKEAAQAQFMAGVEQAATGQALLDIVESRPWYTEIFGPSSSLQGSRAYTVATSIAKFGGEMEEAMPKLAQEGPEALNAALGQKMKELRTGDPTADAAITAQFVDQMAPLYKRHAKEHYIYNQKKASDAQVDTWSSLATGFQKRAEAAARGDGVVSPEDMKAEADRFLGSFAPFADQTDDSYERNVARFMGSAATAGNFQVVQMLKSRGLYDKLNPEYRSQLDATFRTAGRQTLDKAMPKFALDVAMLVNDTAQDPRGVADRAAKLNARAASVTGVSEDMAQLVPSSSLDSIVGHVLRAQAQGLSAGQAAEYKQQAEFAVANSQLDVPGGAGACKAIGTCKETALEQAALARYNASIDPQKLGDLLNNNGTLVFDAIRSNMLSMLGAKEDTPGSQRVAKIYAALEPETQGRYFSPGQRSFLDRYVNAIKGNQSPAAAYQQALVAQPMSKYVLDPKEKSEVAQSLRAFVEKKAEKINGVAGWLGVNGIDDHGLRVAETVVGASVATSRGINSVDASVQKSIGEAVQTGRLQIVGKRAIIGDYSSGQQKPLTELMINAKNGNMGADETAEAFNGVLEKKAADLKLDGVGEYSIIRVPDRKDTAVFHVQLLNGERVENFTLTSDEMKAFHSTAMQAKSPEAKKARRDLVEGSQYGSLPGP